MTGKSYYNDTRIRGLRECKARSNPVSEGAKHCLTLTFILLKEGLKPRISDIKEEYTTHAGNKGHADRTVGSPES